MEIYDKGGTLFLTRTLMPDEVFTPEDFTSENLAYAEAAKNFVKKEVMPVNDRIEAGEKGLMESLVRRAGKEGLLMGDVPVEYGGLGLDKVSSALIAEGVSAQASFMTSMNGHNGIGSLPIIFYGSDELKNRYLPEMAAGRLLGCYALTEPGAGSDALAGKTRAILSEDGKNYILNGVKQFITNAGFADVFTVFAKVDGTHFTGFVIDRTAPGLKIGPEEKKLGLKGSSTASVILEDAVTPVENVLGEVGKGHKIAFNVLNFGRFKVGTQSMGEAKAAFAEALAYTLQRKQFGKRIIEFGAIREKLARMHARLFAAETIAYRTVGMMEGGLVNASSGEEKLKVIEGYSVECAMVKIYCTETLGFVADESLQCFGGYGYSTEYPAERYFRDARITRIYEGTNEINRTIIPRMILKRALSGSLPLFEGPAAATPSGRGWEMIAAMKSLFKNALARAHELYGEGIFDRQMELSRIAEMAIMIYAAESAFLRARKDEARRGPEKAALKNAASTLVLEDAADAIVRMVRQMGFPKSPLGEQPDEARFLAEGTGAKILDLQEFIAAKLEDAERLYW